MADFAGIFKEIMTMTERVGALKESVDKLWSKVDDHHDRILRLETREDVLVEKMRSNAAEAVSRMTTEYYNRLAAVEKKLGVEPGRGGRALPKD